MRIPIKIIMRTPNNKGTKTKIFHNEEIAYIRAHFKKKRKRKMVCGVSFTSRESVLTLENNQYSCLFDGILRKKRISGGH